MSSGTLSAFPTDFFYMYKDRNSQHIARAYGKKEKLIKPYRKTKVEWRVGLKRPIS